VRRRGSGAAVWGNWSNLEHWASRDLRMFGKEKCNLARRMEKRKEPAPCRPGGEKAKADAVAGFSCWNGSVFSVWPLP